MKHALTYIILLFHAAQVRAQSYDFIHLNVENGLSHKSVLSIAQDKRGFIWMGTADGLNRYDSRDFRVYFPANGANQLASSYILSLLCDTQGNLWVGTANGLYRYRAKTDDFETIKLPRTRDGKFSHTINCLLEDRRGQLWIGSNSGVYLLQKGVATIFPAKGLPASPVIHAFAEDHTGAVWIGSTTGLLRAVPSAGGFSTQLFLHRPGATGSLSDDNISSIAVDEQHQVWIGTQQKGLDLYQPLSNDFRHFAGPDRIRTILSDRQGGLWIGSQDGLYRFDKARNHFTPYRYDPDDSRSLSQNSIYSLCIDRDQTLWVGTYFGGANITIPSVFETYQSSHFRSGISSNVVSSFAEEPGGGLWVGTEGGGLNFIDRRHNRVQIYEHRKDDPTSLSSNLVKALYRDRSGLLWIGTSHDNGINVLQPGSQGFTKCLYLDSIFGATNIEGRCFAEDSDGIFWVGANLGLRLFHKEGKKLRPCSDPALPTVLRNRAINCFYKDSLHNIWIGSWGLFVFDKSRHAFLSLGDLTQQKTPLTTARINCIAADASGTLWIGTDKEGLFSYNPSTRRITSYTEVDGLANNNVYGIIHDNKGRLWISTGNGLSCFAVRTKNFFNYTRSDGLAGNDFNKNAFARLSTGELVFGGFRGFTAFYPEHIRQNHIRPVALISGLRLFNQLLTPAGSQGILSSDISLSHNIRLKHSQNVFTIDFVILNYIRSEKNRYAYMIEGIDKDWNYTGLPSATYNNLPEGHYRFLARGANNDGIWSEPVSLNIHILPPWYRTWWAYGLYILAVAAMIFLVARYFFLQALLKRDKALTAQKLNFFTNISHEIRTYLSLIIGPAERLLTGRPDNDPDLAPLQTIRKNSDSLLQLVNELMDFRKAETGNLELQVAKYNIVPFAASVHDSFHELALSRNIVSEFVADASRIEVYFDKEQMKKVLFNLLSNAYKFTPAGGYVRLSVEELRGHVQITVADNGKGISPANLQRLFDNYFQENDYGGPNTGYGIGLALSKSIVNLHKGDLSAESVPVQGQEKELHTFFRILLKKGPAHFHATQLAAIPSSDEPVLPAPLPAATISTGTIPETGPSVKRYTVLVVEDNPEVRQFMAGGLRPIYEVIETGNGREGFETAARHIPDLIISDVMMPEMDGHAFCQTIKNDTRTDHIPVIMLTARSSVADHTSGLQSGADVYLTKPFSLQVLLLQVQNLLASSEKLRKHYHQKLMAPAVRLSGLGSTVPVVTAEAAPSTKTVAAQDFIHRIVALTEVHMSDPSFDVEMICRHLTMSQTVLYRKLKALTDMTPNEIVKSVRLRKAAELLAAQQYTVYEVADRVGYNDTKYFSREFKKQFGVSPRDYKQGGPATREPDQ